MGRRLAAQADVFSLQCLACILALVFPIDEVLCTLTGVWTAVAALLCGAAAREWRMLGGA